MGLPTLRSVLLVALALAGCQGKSVRTLKDTEGRAIEARCSKEGDCELRLRSGATASPDKKTLVLRASGNLVAVCDTNEGKPASATDCRALECSSDAECPPAHGLENGTCINGLCREPATQQLNTDDAIMLCLAGTGLGATRTDLEAMARNCGNPCRVPTVCRQP